MLLSNPGSSGNASRVSPLAILHDGHNQPSLLFLNTSAPPSEQMASPATPWAGGPAHPPLLPASSTRRWIPSAVSAKFLWLCPGSHPLTGLGDLGLLTPGYHTETFHSCPIWKRSPPWLKSPSASILSLPLHIKSLDVKTFTLQLPLTAIMPRKLLL